MLIGYERLLNIGSEGNTNFTLEMMMASIRGLFISAEMRFGGNW